MTGPGRGSGGSRGRRDRNDGAGGRGGRRGERGPTPAQRREEHAAETDPDVVLAAALRFLEVRSRSISEVRRRLRMAGYPVELIEGSIERLLELGFLDDAAFARAWVESRDRARPRGERALRLELQQKGVAREVTDAALEDRRDEAVARGGAGDEEGQGDAGESVDEAAAQRLLERRAAQLGRVPDPRVRRQRAYALLARNGFDPSVCSTAARRFAEGPDEASEVDSEEE